MWEIISGEVPFSNYPYRAAVRTAVLISLYSIYPNPLQIMAGERPAMVECPQPYEEMIKLGWAQEPSNRPSAVGKLLPGLTFSRVIFFFCRND